MSLETVGIHNKFDIFDISFKIMYLLINSLYSTCVCYNSCNVFHSC